MAGHCVRTPHIRSPAHFGTSRASSCLAGSLQRSVQNTHDGPPSTSSAGSGPCQDPASAGGMGLCPCGIRRASARAFSRGMIPTPSGA
eukprot:15442950-Alexandrium_andersonii.AAC.1